MSFVFVYAGTRQPLPAGTRVYGVEVGPDRHPKGPSFLTDVDAGGGPGKLEPLGFPLSSNESPSSFSPSEQGKYQVIAIPKQRDFGSPQEAYQALRRCPPLSFSDGRLPAVAVAGLRADQSALAGPGTWPVRFRAVAKDGEELVSSALALADSGPGPRLALPKIAEPQARCGVKVTLSVFARALEGQAVQLQVESGDGKSFKPVGAPVSAQVQDGRASASFEVPGTLLPAAKSRADESKPASKLRFRAIADAESVASPEVPLLPPPYAGPKSSGPPPKADKKVVAKKK